MLEALLDSLVGPGGILRGMPPLRRAAFQPSLLGLSQLEDAVERLATAGSEMRGAIFTRREVVDFVLDLVGYTADRELHDFQLLEPSVGHGDFLLPAAERLLSAYRRCGGDLTQAAQRLSGCILGVEVHRASYEEAQRLLHGRLRELGLDATQTRLLVNAWLYQGDFLLLPHSRKFSHIIGNPPYVGQELIADQLMVEYRRRFQTIYDRADLYVLLTLFAPTNQKRVIGRQVISSWS